MSDVDPRLAIVIGMSLAYVASFAGMALAWWSWRRRQRDDESEGRR